MTARGETRPHAHEHGCRRQDSGRVPGRPRGNRSPHALWRERETARPRPTAWQVLERPTRRVTVEPAVPLPGERSGDLRARVHTQPARAGSQQHGAHVPSSGNPVHAHRRGGVRPVWCGTSPGDESSSDTRHGAGEPRNRRAQRRAAADSAVPSEGTARRR